MRCNDPVPAPYSERCVLVLASRTSHAETDRERPGAGKGDRCSRASYARSHTCFRISLSFSGYVRSIDASATPPDGDAI